MRSPVIAFSIIAAAAVSPVLVSAAPASPKLVNAIAQTEAIATHHIRQTGNIVDVEKTTQATDGLVGGLTTGSSGSSQPASSVTDDPVHRTQSMRKAHDQALGSGKDVKVPTTKFSKRASDSGTAGGNAYSGASSNAIGGDVDNVATNGALTNTAGGKPDPLSAHCLDYRH